MRKMASHAIPCAKSSTLARLAFGTKGNGKNVEKVELASVSCLGNQRSLALQVLFSLLIDVELLGFFPSFFLFFYIFWVSKLLGFFNVKIISFSVIL